jgi:hypothetical protein
MGGGHFQNMMYLWSYVRPLDLHIMAGFEDQAFPSSPTQKALPGLFLLPEGFDASWGLVRPLDLHIMAGLEEQAFLSYTESTDNCETAVSQL